MHIGGVGQDQDCRTWVLIRKHITQTQTWVRDNNIYVCNYNYIDNDPSGLYYLSEVHIMIREHVHDLYLYQIFEWFEKRESQEFGNSTNTIILFDKYHLRMWRTQKKALSHVSLSIISLNHVRAIRKLFVVSAWSDTFKFLEITKESSLTYSMTILIIALPFV